MPCAIVIKSFTEDYEPHMVPVKDKDGNPVLHPDTGNPMRLVKEMQKVHYIEYYPAQDSGVALIKRKVHELLDIEDDGDPHNLMLQQVRERNEIIKSAYQHWLTGVQDNEVAGWPLSQWQGVTKGEVAILRMYGFRSVEELATAPEHKLVVIPLPNPVDLKARAMRFLASGDQERAAQKMAEKDAKIERLESKVEQLTELMEKLLAAGEAGASGVAPAPSTEAASKRKGRARVQAAEPAEAATP